MNILRSLLGLASFAFCALLALPSAESRAARRGRRAAICDGCGAPMPGSHRVPGPGEFWNLAACRAHPGCPMPEAEAAQAERSRPVPYQPGR